MVKAIAGSIVVVLVVSVTTFAGIGDVVSSQNPNIGLINGVAVSSGIATASNVQGIGLLAIQNGSSTTGTNATQGIGAVLIQGARINTVHAPMSATQTLTVDGAALVDPQTLVVTDGPGQSQSVGLGTNPIYQYEGVAVVATQTLTKAQGGQGSVQGGQGVILGMGQVADNTTSDAGQGSGIIAGQIGGIDGGAAAAGTVTGTMSAVIVQKQQVN